jgi:hypothetical protein
VHEVIQRSEHLFVVRMWREQAAVGQGQWRGSVDHVTSGQKHYFSNTSDLIEFVTLRLEERHTPSGRSVRESR